MKGSQSPSEPVHEDVSSTASNRKMGCCPCDRGLLLPCIDRHLAEYSRQGRIFGPMGIVGGSHRNYGGKRIGPTVAVDRDIAFSIGDFHLVSSDSLELVDSPSRCLSGSKASPWVRPTREGPPIRHQNRVAGMVRTVYPLRGLDSSYRPVAKLAPCRVLLPASGLCDS